MYSQERRGPRTDPCETPHRTLVVLNLKTACWNLHKTHDVNRSRTTPCTTNSPNNTLRRERSTVSKAAQKSSRARRGYNVNVHCEWMNEWSWNPTSLSEADTDAERGKQNPEKSMKLGHAKMTSYVELLQFQLLVCAEGKRCFSITVPGRADLSMRSLDGSCSTGISWLGEGHAVTGPYTVSFIQHVPRCTGTSSPVALALTGIQMCLADRVRGVPTLN